MIDVTHLQPTDLEALSSPLTLRRAQRALDAGQRPVSTTHTASLDGVGSIQISWREATCTFPSQRLAASRCTCLARRLCVHRVRTVLYLQQHPPSAAPSAKPAPPWTPSCWERVELERASGATLWASACAALQDGLVVQRESDTAATIPSLGIRVRFLPGRPLSEAICSCRAARLCVHRVLAALAWQDPPQTARTAPLDRPVEAARSRCWARVATLMMTGLDGAPPETVEGLRALSQQVSSVLPEPSRDLNGLAEVLLSYQARSARSGAPEWLQHLGRLGARLLSLASSERTEPTVALRGHSRRTHMVASALTLAGLGAEGFQSRQGTMLRCWFLALETGDWVHTSVGRTAAPDKAPLPPRALWRAPLWGHLSPSDVAHGCVHVTGARLSPEGSLSTTNVHVRPLPDPVAPDRFPAGTVAHDIASLAERWAQQAPPILRSQRQQWLPAVIALSERRPFLDAPTFSEASQSLTLPVSLRSEETITLEVPARQGNEQTLSVLERLKGWSAHPSHLSVRFWLTDAGITAEPIAAWLPGSTAPRSLGLGPPLASARRSPWRQVVTTRSAPPVSPPMDSLRGLLDLLESLAVEGMAQSRWRLDALRDHATLLDGVGLTQGAAQVRRLADAIQQVTLRSDGTPNAVSRHFLLLLAWATTVEEAWQLQQCLPPDAPQHRVSKSLQK